MLKLKLLVLLSLSDSDNIIWFIVYGLKVKLYDRLLKITFGISVYNWLWARNNF